MKAAEIFSSIVKRGIEYLGLYYSSYRGFVISNDDPDNLSRLQLKVPQVYGDDIMTYWAWPKNTYSGKDYGAQLIPEVKDVVWVEFEMGNPRRPIWSFGHFGKNEKPEDLQGKKQIWFKTPDGHLLQIDRDNNTIRVKHKDNNEIIIDGSKIKVTHKDNSEIIIDGTKIRVTHQDGLVLEINKNNISLGEQVSSAYSALLGEIVKTELNKEKDRVTAIMDALKNSATATDYSGSTYKANIALALVPYSLPTTTPDYSDILSKSVTLKK